MTVRWRHCVQADEEHRENLRQYAHTYHYAETICLAKSFWQLPKSYRDGIILHEIGHLLAGPQGNEDDANRAVEQWSGAKIHYVDSPYGNELERLINMGARVIARRRNPLHHGHELPYDEWVPAHAVMFNSDGTVDVMTESEHEPRRNIMAGFHDEEGIFHPIRASADYDSSRVGEISRRKKAKLKRKAKARKRR